MHHQNNVTHVAEPDGGRDRLDGSTERANGEGLADGFADAARALANTDKLMVAQGVGEGPPGCVLGVDAEERSSRGIHQGHGLLLIHDHHAVGHGTQDNLQLRMTLANGTESEVEGMRGLIELSRQISRASPCGRHRRRNLPAGSTRKALPH